MAMERENRPVRGAGKRRKKVCQFCVDKCECIDYSMVYSDVLLLTVHLDRHISRTYDRSVKL